MAVRGALKTVAILVAVFALGQAAFAQQVDDEAPITTPADSVGEAPEPAYNPAAEEDFTAFITCMGVYYEEETDEPAADRAAQEAACTTVIETGPADQRRSAYFARAQIRTLDGRMAQTLEDFDALVALDPRDGYALQFRGSLHGRMGRFDLARADNMAALMINPLDASAHNSMCWTLAMEGKDLDRALNYCNISIGLMSRNAAALDSRGMVYLKMGDYEKALADFQSAVWIHPDSAHFMYGRGIVLLRMGREAEGRKWIARAIEADPAIVSQYEIYGVTP